LLDQDRLPLNIDAMGLLEDLANAAITASNVAQDTLKNAGDPIGSVFQGVVNSNLATSTSASVPTSYIKYALEYSLANKADGLILATAIARPPIFRYGGWILNTVDPLAMTLDRYVFCKKPLKLDTYVHELVHVQQCKLLGRTGFLVSYFGMTAADIAYHWLTRTKMKESTSSPHEFQAYKLEERFEAWLIKKYPGEKINLYDY
jgi:hypothetical protein